MENENSMKYDEYDDKTKSDCKTKVDCTRRNYPTADALEDAYNAGYKAGCKKTKEKALKCIDKIECC